MSTHPHARVINSVAPIRICDNGGWTDTWFARYGKIFNIAVYPYVEVQMVVHERPQETPRVVINAENYGHHYTLSESKGLYEKHPLLEAAVEYMRIPKNIEIHLAIHSEAPSGCSTGTSAAVSVAMIGCLDCLTPGRLTPYEVARAAHDIETKMLKQQCGVQDQIASAFGGINYIEVFEYPYASVSPLHVGNPVWWELESRLSLIYVGQSHNSTEVHKKVIRELEDAGPDAAKLQPLRRTAEASRDALYAGDFSALGKAMVDNTEAQALLHPELIGPGHQRIIDVAQQHGAIGWKVNGAGGSGGSVTLLSGPDRSRKRAMLRDIEAADPAFRTIPIYLSRFGLRVWESPLQ